MTPAARACRTVALLVAAAAACPAALKAQGSEALTRDEIRRRAAELVAGAATAYVSDYVSFAGADEAGRVAFALDTNRGRAEGEHQAEHFVVMHDEQGGWIDVEGDTEIANDAGVLLEWPASPYFEITGEPYAPGTLRSRPNGLVLEIGTLEPRTTTVSATTLFSMASAPATLEWRGRSVEGRVIYEHLAMRGSNRLAGGIGGALAILAGGPNFQGLYLAGPEEDLYVHRAPAAAASTQSPLVAFWARGGENLRTGNLTFEVTDFDAAFGFYRWPAAWRATWRSGCGEARLTVETLEHATQSNWITGGFAMRTAEAKLTCGGTTTTLHGFAELIR